MFTLDQLDVPIVQAPLAGGPSTPELAAAVARPAGSGSSRPDTRRRTRAGRDRAVRALSAAVRRQRVRRRRRRPRGCARGLCAQLADEAEPGSRSASRGMTTTAGSEARAADRGARCRWSRSRSAAPTARRRSAARRGVRGLGHGHDTGRGRPPPRPAPTRSSCRASRRAGTAARSTTPRLASGCCRCCARAGDRRLPLVASGGIADGAAWRRCSRPAPPRPSSAARSC